jgi:hypothetical protein
MRCASERAHSLSAGQEGAFTFRALIWPTLLFRFGQVLAAQSDAATQSGFMLTIDDGQFTLVVGDGLGAVRREPLAARMLDRKWYAVTLTLDAAAGCFRCQIARNRDPHFGVRPCGWTESSRRFDRLPGVSILELHGAEISQRRV